jgi:diadenosine tetraphosphate (Ap4A) HIT family hydrolase
MSHFILHPQLEKDSVFITDLTLCAVRLLNDVNYPWLILVPRQSDICEVLDLTDNQQCLLWQESALVSRVLTQLFTPDKLNIATLGNMVSQLHLHLVVRYKNDISWPRPIWGQVPVKPYSAELLTQRIELIKTAIEARS